ncbi:hypothetical protein WT97_20930 [Burkholderia sp. MSMB1459WGS]|uniref:hypothetical protein n=1 Tax=Burkholderia sp. MSMB1459WGS TaxID=1637970 RepID=UPI00075FBFE4|nr:hypothetical protein [Burkholderia sp. MSMB1459WGS]KWO40475.1 hypothetical protein WT97_20930 [Burkholderia sp. MSMB1459WGS]
MKYTQAELRREFPVYDLVEPRFAAWLVADPAARLAWLGMRGLIARATRAAFDDAAGIGENNGN